MPLWMLFYRPLSLPRGFPGDFSSGSDREEHMRVKNIRALQRIREHLLR